MQMIIIYNKKKEVCFWRSAKSDFTNELFLRENGKYLPDYVSQIMVGFTDNALSVWDDITAKLIYYLIGYHWAFIANADDCMIVTFIGDIFW